MECLNGFWTPGIFWLDINWTVLIVMSIHEQRMTIFPTKWRANEQQGGGWFAPTRYVTVISYYMDPY